MPTEIFSRGHDFYKNDDKLDYSDDKLDYSDDKLDYSDGDI